MNDTDLTDLIETVCADYWDARILIDGREPWSEQTLDTKNRLKEAVIPWIFRAAPLLSAKAHEDTRRFVAQAREAGAPDADIIDLLLQS
jgi:DNA repair photolyase